MFTDPAGRGQFTFHHSFHRFPVTLAYHEVTTFSFVVPFRDVLRETYPLGRFIFHHHESCSVKLCKAGKYHSYCVM